MVRDQNANQRCPNFSRRVCGNGMIGDFDKMRLCPEPSLPP
jgi:hypothetical protein